MRDIPGYEGLQVSGLFKKASLPIAGVVLFVLLALPASADIRWTYSGSEPEIRHLQGGILYPYQPEQVEVTTGEGTETMWRFKLLKFGGDATEISDDFQSINAASINAQASNAVDIQKLSTKEEGWMQKIPNVTSSTVVRLEKDLTQDEKEALIEYYEVWSGDGQSYVAGQILRHNSGLFKVLQPHTSQPDWTPTAAGSLFTEVVPPSVIPEWVQPEGAHDSYDTGAQVTHNGHLWESDIDANVWEPGVYGWKDLGVIE